MNGHMYTPGGSILCFVTVFGSEPLVKVSLASKYWFTRIDHKDVFAVFFWLNVIEYRSFEEEEVMGDGF